MFGVYWFVVGFQVVLGFGPEVGAYRRLCRESQYLFLTIFGWQNHRLRGFSG